jgi:hypothetical protein
MGEGVAVRPDLVGKRRVFRDGRRARLVERIDRMELLVPRAEVEAALTGFGWVMLAVAMMAMLVGIPLLSFTGHVVQMFAMIAVMGLATCVMVVGRLWLDVDRGKVAVRATPHGLTLASTELPWHEIAAWREQDAGVALTDRSGRTWQTPALRAAERILLTDLLERHVLPDRPEAPPELRRLRAVRREPT